VNARAVLVWFAAGLLPLLGGALPLLGVEVGRLLSAAYAWGWLFGFGAALVLYPLLAAPWPRPGRTPAAP
jgi:cytosine/uracil/thiamine/allantoin permease